MLLRAVVSVIYLANVWANSCKLNDVIFSGNYDFIDLSHKFDNHTIYWPNMKRFEFTKMIGMVGVNNSWYAANDFEAGEHGGTHIDAPFHFHREGKYVGDLTLDKLIVPLIIVDVGGLVDGDPNFILYKHHLDYMLNTNGGKPCMLVFKFGWSRFYGDRNKYLGVNDDGTLNFPANDFEAGEHGGTHIDAPFHFHREGKYVGDLTLDKLIVPLIIVDVGGLVDGDPNFILYKHHLDYMLNTNGGKPCMLVFKFGWSRFYGDRNKYLGVNDDGTLNFPGLSKEVAEWIISYKNIVGVGVDTASVDPGSSTDYPVHRTLYPAGLYGMENVNLDTHVPEHGCTGIALPMKIAKGTGGPLRLVAICPKQKPTEF